MRPLLPLLLALQNASAADLLVGPTQQYSTIEDAARWVNAGDRIVVDPGVYPEDMITLNNDQFTITAAQAGTVTVLLNIGEDNFFDLKNNSVLTLVDISFDGLAGGRLVEMHRSTLVLDRALISRMASPSAGKGGAVVATFSTLDIRNSDVAGSLSATGNGGVLHLTDTTLYMAYSTIRQGFTAVEGGGLSATQGSLVTIEYSSFLGNVADAGSAIDIDSGDLILRSSVVQGNASVNGTIRCTGTALCSLEQTWFQDNISSTGTMLISDGSTSTLVLGNSLCGASGSNAVELINTSATVNRSIFYDNQLTGPLLHVAATATADIVNNHFVGSTSTTDGAVARIDGSATFVNNLVSHNTSAGPALSVPGTLTNGYNLFFLNLNTHTDGVLDPSTLLDIDPLIAPVSPSYCDLLPLIPSGISPVVDAGDPSILDDDGTVADIGAFGNLIAPPTSTTTTGTTTGTGTTTTGTTTGTGTTTTGTTTTGTTTTGTTTTTGGLLDNDNDGLPAAIDCDDNDPTVFPGAVEILCDNKDNDCDPLTPDGIDNDGDGVSQCDEDCDDNNPDYWVPVDVWKDKDKDGYGKIADPTKLCGLPFDGSHVTGDCDDKDDTIFPGAEEIPYDDVDQDCDGEDIEDIDGDGSHGLVDCDDHNPNRAPGLYDIPLDGLDQDCTGFDAGLVLIGGAGLNCAGCDNSGHATGWWMALLLLTGLRRRD
jgi:hypothetical protein